MTRHRRPQQRGHRRLHRTGRRIALRHGNDLKARPARIPTTRCAIGKRRYFVVNDAELVLAGLDHTDPRRREKRSYRCPVCHGWHLTSWSAEQFEAHRATTPEATLSAATVTVERDRVDLSAISTDCSAMPTPGEVALRTVPFKRAEAARLDVHTYSAPLQQESATATASIGTRMRMALRHMLRHFLQI